MGMCNVGRSFRKVGGGITNVSGDGWRWLEMCGRYGQVHEGE